jgi:hypothetical protein
LPLNPFHGLASSFRSGVCTRGLYSFRLGRILRICGVAGAGGRGPCARRYVGTSGPSDGLRTRLLGLGCLGLGRVGLGLRGVVLGLDLGLFLVRERGPEREFQEVIRGGLACVQLAEL